MSSLGYGQGTWGNNPWGGFISVDVSVTGFGLTSSLGTIPAVHSDAPLPIILGWGEGGFGQNRWGGRVSTAFGVNDDGFSVTGSVGSVTVTGTGAVSLTGVSATATLDFDSTTDINIPISFAVTGLGATSALGNETAFTNVAVAVTQSQISSNVGSVDFDGDANVPLTGLGATSALGNESTFANVIFAVTGLAGTTALGDEVAAPQTIVSPSGSAGTGAVGNATAIGASNHTATGSTGTGAVGSVTLVGASNHTATGSTGTGSTGTLTILPSIEVVPTGAEGTGGTGTPFVGGGAKVVEDGLTGSVNIGDEAVSAGANVFPTGVSASGFLSNPASGTLGDVITFTVTQASKASYDFGSYNAFYINGVERQVLTLVEGKTYRFDQSDATNDGHPLRFSLTSNGTHAGGSEYTEGVTAVGTPGTSGAYTEISLSEDSPTLYYYCTNHSNMGSTILTFNSTVNIIGQGVVVPTTATGTGAVGTLTALPSIEVDVSTVIGTSSVGTLDIEGDLVVSLTGVGGTGVIANLQIFSIIKPTQVANWVEKAA